MNQLYLFRNLGPRMTKILLPCNLFIIIYRIRIMFLLWNPNKEEIPNTMFRDSTYLASIAVCNCMWLQRFCQILKELIWNLHCTDEDQKSEPIVYSYQAMEKILFGFENKNLHIKNIIWALRRTVRTVLIAGLTWELSGPYKCPEWSGSLK